MSKVLLSIESTCDIDKKELDKLGVKYIDLGLIGGDGEKVSGLTLDQFYERLRKGEHFKTSLINEYEYEEYFSELTKEGEVVHLAFSSGVSGSCACAKNASETVNKKCQNKVHVVDSLSGSGGQAIILRKALELLKEGKSVKELIAELEEFKQCVRLEFSPVDLKTLARGGRCNKVVALIGNVLNIKPIIHLNENGSFSIRQKVISRKRALARMIELFKENYNKKSKYVYILHGDTYSEADYICSELKKCEEYKDVVFIVDLLGSIVSAHGGAGNICLAYTSDKK